MSAKVLITGSAGFIGSSLAEHLISSGFEVIGLDNFSPFYPRGIKERNIATLKENSNFKFIEGDIKDADLLESIPDFDLLVHLAAKAGVRPSIENPQAYIDTNITGTHNLLKLCVSRSVKKIVFASSSSIYGNSKHLPFVEEGYEYEPISPYAFTKRSCELMNHTYHHLYDLDIINLRFFTVFGPRQRPDLAIHKFVRLLEAGEEIPMFGDGSTARDYTFIDDIVGGIKSSMDYLYKHEGVFEIVNLGNHTPVKLKNMIEAVADVVGVEPKIKELPMQDGDVDITFASIEKAKRLFGYNPGTSFKDGLEKFYEWHKSLAH
jgi:nucleoside-diphosphate-sugar epimerase